MPNSRGKLVLRLVHEDDVQDEKRPRWKLVGTSVILTALALIAFGTWAGHVLWPKMPENLTPIEAAKILYSNNGFAGYSLINTNGNEDGTLRHDMFCPSCGNPIASVNVVFLAPREPQLGSRLALMTSLAKSAIAAPPPKKREATPPRPVTALIATK